MSAVDAGRACCDPCISLGVISGFHWLVSLVFSIPTRWQIMFGRRKALANHVWQAQGAGAA
ncbi:hypothetical protein [Pseudomonas sp. W5-36]|uniref:hypothetical protein n=1 Tax=Pseudomonas sp. W5-36 TaxID=3097455 RepID=UPI00397DFF1A